MNDGFLKAAALSPSLRVADCAYNTSQILSQLKDAAARGVRLAVFPEFCLTGYTCGDLFLQRTLQQGALDGLQTLLDASIPPHEDKGSIITVLATDIPLSERQLRRLCHRALVGLSRTGSFCGNGSGEIVIAFTTANRVPHDSEKAILPMGMVHDDAINPLFRAVAECVEESVLSSLLHAETVTGHHGRTVKCLSDLLKYSNSTF